jgi:hypothetical protein
LCGGSGGAVLDAAFDALQELDRRGDVVEDEPGFLISRRDDLGAGSKGLDE